MRTLVVLLATNISEYAFKPLAKNSKSAFFSAYERAMQFPDTVRCIVPVQDSECEKIKQLCKEKIAETAFVSLPNNTASVLFNTLIPLVADIDHVFFSWADAPFLDAEKTAQLYDQHCTYRAECSFADGYPEGILPYIIEGNMISLLAKLPQAVETPLTRTFLFDLIKKDINTYDLETMIAPVDVRSFRLHFYTDTKAAWLICQTFTDITAENYADLIYARQEQLRPLPAYYGIEITAYHPLSSLYRPAIFNDVFSPSLCMDMNHIQKIIDSIASFSETAVISLSLYGEPLLHPQIADIVAAILSYPSLSVLIETSGVGGTAELYKALQEKVSAAPARTHSYLPLYWIVSIDAVSPKMYSRIHRLPDEKASLYLKQAVTATGDLTLLFPDAVWPQMVRMNDNEEELEPFYRFWEQRTGKPLIQKYDPLCGLLPDCRTADLSPLERHPCWHLKRDISICNDGTVPLCKEDIQKSIILGNIFSDSLDAIWQNGQRYYQEQVKSVYKGLCGKCDEYYTYNF